jgi:DNA-binding NarL/FixJ family response regulator
MDDFPARRGGRSSVLPQLLAAIVDDHPVYRLGLVEALRAAPEIAVAWTAGSPAEALQCIDATPVDILITDLHFKGGLDAVAMIAHVRSQRPEVRIAVISGLADEDSLAAALAAGAVVYLPKDLPPGEMVRRLVSLGSPARGAVGANGSRVQNGLSRREAEVLSEMRRGSTNREIAQALGVSTNTVNKHVHRILTKLNVRNRAEAIGRSHLG